MMFQSSQTFCYLSGLSNCSAFIMAIMAVSLSASQDSCFTVFTKMLKKGVLCLVFSHESC